MTVDLIMEDARWETLNLLHIANAAFEETLSHLNMSSEIFICCILACNSKKIKRLNAKFRGKNSCTNVLSFPSAKKNCKVKSSSRFETNVGAFELGDIAIAFEVCKKEADISEIDFEHHVYHLVIHSLLHLLGYDHEEEKNAAEMEKIEVQVLANIGINNPYLKSL